MSFFAPAIIILVNFALGFALGRLIRETSCGSSEHAKMADYIHRLEQENDLLFEQNHYLKQLALPLEDD